MRLLHIVGVETPVYISFVFLDVHGYRIRDQLGKHGGINDRNILKFSEIGIPDIKDIAAVENNIKRMEKVNEILSPIFRRIKNACGLPA